MKKENFLDILMGSTPEEINEFIERKGKDRKFINVITFNDTKEENHEKSNSN